MFFLCHCKPSSLDEKHGWLPLWNLEGTNTSCPSTCLCWGVLKAWAEQWLSCPPLQCWVPGLLWISTDEAQRVLCACLGDGCSRFSRSEENAHQGQGTVPHRRQPIGHSEPSALTSHASSCVLHVWLRENFFSCSVLRCLCLGIDAAERRTLKQRWHCAI